MDLPPNLSSPTKKYKDNKVKIIIKYNKVIKMNSFNLKIFLSVLFLFLLIDLPMILFINKGMYRDLFKGINGLSSPKTEKVIVSAIGAYVLMALAITMLASDWKSGMILGLVIYGIYDFTNSATITRFGMKEALIDMTWGTLLFAVVSYIVYQK